MNNITTAICCFNSCKILLMEKIISLFCAPPPPPQIGFPSLTRIQHGFVRIDKSPILCYADAVSVLFAEVSIIFYIEYAQIDWEAITDEKDGTLNGNAMGNFIRNGDLVDCPTTSVCRGCDPRYCWNPFMCQRFETGLDAFGECLKECQKKIARVIKKMNFIHHH